MSPLESYPAFDQLQRYQWLRQNFNGRVNGFIVLLLARQTVYCSANADLHSGLLDKLEEALVNKSEISINREFPENFIPSSVESIKVVRLPYYASMVYWNAFEAIIEQTTYCNSGLVADYASTALSYYRSFLEQQHSRPLTEQGLTLNSFPKSIAIKQIKDILNLFLPIDTWKPEKYHNATTTQLAKTIYDTKDWSLCPILADALMDAGCDDDYILGLLKEQNHLFSRGVWIIDQLAGTNNGN